MFNSYAYKYMFCECLCLLNILAQTLFTDIFLDGQFITYGFKVLQPQLWKYLSFNSEQRSSSSSPNNNQSVESFVNPFGTLIFPRLTKCTFNYFGASGDVQRKDALCLLPLNVFHEKIYLFIWFWFAFLLITTTLLILIRIVMILGLNVRAPILKTRCKFCSLKHLRIICQKGNIGDFFVLYQLGKNIDPIVMQEVVYDLSKRLVRAQNYLSFDSPKFRTWSN